MGAGYGPDLPGLRRTIDVKDQYGKTGSQGSGLEKSSRRYGRYRLRRTPCGCQESASRPTQASDDGDRDRQKHSEGGAGRERKLKPWRKGRSERIFDSHIFSLDRVRFDPPESDREGADFFVSHAPAWINVIARTSDDRLIFIRQFRFGVERITLEIPGGMCDAGEEPFTSARRELREETGYVSDCWYDLGSVEPNPALQDNRCHMFFADNVRLEGEQRLDPHERIDVETIPFPEVSGMIRSGEISHSLVVAAFYRYDLHLSSPFERISAR